MAYAKEDPKILTVTIDENGDMIYLKTPLSDVLLELGTVVTKRASHVEPDTFFARMAFRALRLVVTDNSRIAQWTRGWNVRWRVDTRPVGGPVLRWADVYGARQIAEMARVHGSPAVFGLGTVATWRCRQDAIDAEIKFLNEFFLTR